MKIYKHIIAAVLIITIVSCRRKGNDTNDPGKDTSFFKTQSEAVIRGKNDLISILRSTSAFQIAVNPELLEKSQPGISVKHLDVDFDELIKQGQVNNLDQLRNNAKSTINTLMVDNNVLTVIETSNSDKGFAVTGLANASLSNDIAEVLSTKSSIESVTLYEVESLQAFIYKVKTAEGESYHTNYNGFTIKEEISIDRLYEIVRNDALVLQRKYGNELKSQKLVK